MVRLKPFALVGLTSVIYALFFYFIFPLVMPYKDQVPVDLILYGGYNMSGKLGLLSATRAEYQREKVQPSTDTLISSNVLLQTESPSNNSQSDEANQAMMLKGLPTEVSNKEPHPVNTSLPKIVVPKPLQLSKVPQTFEPTEDNGNAVETKAIQEATMATPSCRDKLCTEFLDDSMNRYFKRCKSKAVGPNSAHIDQAKCHFMNSKHRAPVALVSVPGAGCTWLRGLIEKATGVCTGSIYCDIPLRRGGFVGEYIKSGNVLVVKTHTSDYQWKGIPVEKRNKADAFYGSAILLIRNPFDNFISEHNRLVTLSMRSTLIHQDKMSKNRAGVINRLRNDSSHVSVIGKEYFGENEDWDAFVKAITPRWQKTIQKWFLESMDFDRPILVVRYEDLKKNTLDQVDRALRFLEFPYERSVVNQRLQEDFNAFHRNHTGSNFEHYTALQQELVNQMLIETIEMLTESGVEDLFNLQEYIRQ